MANATKFTFCQMNGSTVEWEINNYLESNYKYNQYIISPVFYTFYDSWEIRLYPEGITTNSSGQTVLSLYLRNTSKNIPKVSWKASIYINSEVVVSKELTHKYNKHQSYGYSDFVLKSLLIQKLEKSASKNVKIICRILNLESNNHETVGTQIRNESFKNLAEDIGRFLSRTDLSDAKIIVGSESQEFHVHKLVLASRSPVFASMFKHGMKEDIISIVDIPDCVPVVFKDFLQFLYCGKIDNVLRENVVGLYRVADKYCVKDLVVQCSVWMAELLDVEIICDVLDLAVTFEETELLGIATDFFFRNAKEIFSTAKWLKFMAEKTDMANIFLIKLVEFTKPNVTNDNSGTGICEES